MVKLGFKYMKKSNQELEHAKKNILISPDLRVSF
jgi:hypothetical protein